MEGVLRVGAGESYDFAFVDGAGLFEDCIHLELVCGGVWFVWEVLKRVEIVAVEWICTCSCLTSQASALVQGETSLDASVIVPEFYAEKQLLFPIVSE